jgi:hypothetical protein
MVEMSSMRRRILRRLHRHPQTREVQPYSSANKEETKMNSKQCAKLAFGNPGFFDFLAPVTNFLRPVSAPLVKASTGLSGAILNAITGSSLPSQAIARPEIQALGQDLFSVGVLSGGAIAGGALAAPAVAGLSLPSLGSLGALGGGSGLLSKLGDQVQKNLPDDIFGGSMDDGDPFSDTFDDDDAGPDEE